MRLKHTYILLCILLFCCNKIFAYRGDSLYKNLRDTSLLMQPQQGINSKKDSTKPKPKHEPRIATKRSMILPGWGQAYNKEYWKIPIVYGALAIPTVTFFYNNKIYKETKFAYDARFKAMQTGATAADSSDFNSLELKYQRADINAIQTLRNAARRDRDYSILWFFILYGLNIADATVFGHLKDFDVSNNLSLNIKPAFNSFSYIPGISLTLKVKQQPKLVTSNFAKP